MMAVSWTRPWLPALLAMTGFLIGLIGLAPSLGHLAQSRATSKMLAEVMARPLEAPRPLIAPEYLLAAPNQKHAQAILRQVLRDVSVREGVLVEAMAETPEAGPVGSLAFTISGNQTHVLRFVEAVEGRTPLIRFARWRIENAGPAASLVRLQATAIVVWSPRL